MDRRTFNKLAGVAAIGALAGNLELEAEQTTLPPSAAQGAAQPSPLSSNQVVLEDSEVLIAFDGDSGALTSFRRKSTHWAIHRRPELGISFRLLAPLPHRRDNFILGQKQRAVEVKKLSNRQIRIVWKNLVSEHGGILPIGFTALITLDNGAVSFDSTLVNDSPLMVETIDYPYLGDLSSSTRDASMHARIMRYDDLGMDEIYPSFSNERGYWGVDFPIKTLDSSYSLFCLIQSPDQGLYVEMRDPGCPYLLQYTFEQHPGMVSGTRVPREDEISGVPVHLEFRTCHFAFVHPHSTKKLVPVVLRGYSGDWHAGIDLYKQWRATWFQKAHLPAWVKDVHSWQQLQINTPEQDYSIPYRNLRKYFDECACNGVTAVQLVGWNKGGQDGGNPSQDTDPGLGTWQELHDAIAYAQSKGVKIILFGKFCWADITTDWYKRELYKYASTDPFGIPYQTGGDSYLTPTQLAAIDNHRFAVMDFLSPAYRDIATREFQKLLALGSAGWLYDEVCDVTVAKYNFAPGHGYAAPGYIYAGALPFGRQLREAADRANPDFLFAGEGPEDWLTQYYPLSYYRGSPTPVGRYIDPHAPMMVAAIGFDDREQLNKNLLHRYITSYEPYNFKGELTAFPLTLEYGKKIDALRKRYKDYVWEAEFRDTVGADVSSDGAHLHSVFVAANGKRAVVVVNEEFDKPITAKANLPNPGKLVVATPEQPDARATSNTLQIPARSVAVMMEV